MNWQARLPFLCVANKGNKKHSPTPHNIQEEGKGSEKNIVLRRVNKTNIRTLKTASRMGR